MRHVQRLKRFHNGAKRRLGVERVEHCFQQQHIHAAFDQRFRLFAIGSLDLIKSDLAPGGIVHIAREGKRFTHGPD